MRVQEYGINLNHLTAREYLGFRDSFEEYKKAVLFLLQIKDRIEFEDDLIAQYQSDFEVQRLMAEGMPGMEAIRSSFPDAFIGAGSRRKIKGKDEYTPAWYHLWQDYNITPLDPNYDLFLAYRLRQADLMELDDILNSLLERYYNGNKVIFSRVLKLTLRKHGQTLLQPEQTDTINEWIYLQEKETFLSGIEETKGKVRIKRSRDDKVTILNQEQITLLIFCLQKTDVILKGELLSNKEAGQAFSILTGYSADTIRQNLSNEELHKISTAKNAIAVQKALETVLKFIDNKVMPE